MTRALTTDEVLALPAAVDIVTAGRAFGIGKNASYELASSGDFPCKVYRLGVLWRVPRADLLRALGLRPDSSEAGESAPATATTSEPASRPEDEVSLT